MNKIEDNVQVRIDKYLRNKTEPLKVKISQKNNKKQKVILKKSILKDKNIKVKERIRLSRNQQQYQKLEQPRILRKAYEILRMKKISHFLEKYEQDQINNSLAKINGQRSESYGPLKKYLQMMKIKQRPSQKQALQPQQSPDQLYRKILISKNQNYLNTALLAIQNLFIKKQQKSEESQDEEQQKATFQNDQIPLLLYSLYRTHSIDQNQQLKRQIKKDIRQQARRERSYKIRIKINHLKMIQ